MKYYYFKIWSMWHMRCILVCWKVSNLDLGVLFNISVVMGTVCKHTCVSECYIR